MPSRGSARNRVSRDVLPLSCRVSLSVYLSPYPHSNKMGNAGTCGRPSMSGPPLMDQSASPEPASNACSEPAGLSTAAMATHGRMASAGHHQACPRVQGARCRSLCSALESPVVARRSFDPTKAQAGARRSNLVLLTTFREVRYPAPMS